MGILNEGSCISTKCQERAVRKEEEKKKQLEKVQIRKELKEEEI